ncbi:unnamed protein product [Neospora caninum Liverpool]|uniref:Rhoptry protein ROP1 n=1 Tax=Neospora caninum (strain Liverpool) TaxID=572307 RepID=F0VML1_NEOCL|nr:uncharacterized protein NCLIV_053840 [Neospora caninum Liverpool]CBZ54957.1 unnamed protein product [Neospora caninum Liverpool]CEL69679.1 TPA: rhoptry protein ROP1 [Neospora caninum Liverpool]|eukprot:XP_003884985.1 uncharacterized protein NCLIV_053840 [Neospora caninum Liverpool]
MKLSSPLILTVLSFICSSDPTVAVSNEHGGPTASLSYARFARSGKRQPQLRARSGSFLEPIEPFLNSDDIGSNDRYDGPLSFAEADDRREGAAVRSPGDVSGSPVEDQQILTEEGKDGDSVYASASSGLNEDSGEKQSEPVTLENYGGEGEPVTKHQAETDDYGYPRHQLFVRPAIFARRRHENTLSDDIWPSNVSNHAPGIQHPLLKVGTGTGAYSQPDQEQLSDTQDRLEEQEPIGTEDQPPGEQEPIGTQDQPLGEQEPIIFKSQANQGSPLPPPRPNLLRRAAGTAKTRARALGRGLKGLWGKAKRGARRVGRGLMSGVGWVKRRFTRNPFRRGRREAVEDTEFSSRTQPQ